MIGQRPNSHTGYGTTSRRTTRGEPFDPAPRAREDAQQGGPGGGGSGGVRRANKDSLALLAAARERARAGHPQRVLVEGPAGIGKTALIRRFLRDDTHVLYGAGEEAEAGLAFGVLEQLLGRDGNGAGTGTGTGALDWGWGCRCRRRALGGRARGRGGTAGGPGQRHRERAVARAPTIGPRAVPTPPGSDDRATRDSEAPPGTSAPDLPLPPSPSSSTTPNGPTMPPSRPSPSPCGGCGPIVCSFSSSCGTPRTRGRPGAAEAVHGDDAVRVRLAGSGPPNWPDSAEGWAYGDSPHRLPHGCTRTPRATPSM